MRNEPEPALDLIDPGGIGQGVVQVVRGPAGHALTNGLSRTVRQVVHNWF